MFKLRVQSETFFDLFALLIFLLCFVVGVNVQQSACSTLDVNVNFRPDHSATKLSVTAFTMFSVARACGALRC